MTVQNQPDNSTGPGSSFSRIDELCDEFEAAWKSGAPRTISSFLTGLEGDERILLLRELLHTELELHKNSGEIPALSRFVTDFPDESSLISRIYNRHFPGVALAEEETVITGEVSSPNSESRRESDTPLHLGVRSTWLWKSGSDTVAEMRAFARRVVEAGLLTEADLTDLREDLPEGRLPVTAAELASLLQDRQLVTEYQVAVLRGWTTEPLVLGNYIVRDVIGSGGMGTVYKAHHRRMDRIVALKVLSPDLMSSRAAVDRFQKEVRAAARLEHPNVVMAYDADEDIGVHFLVMQYVDGRDLGSVVKKGGCLSTLRALECVLQVAEGLEYAHSKGVIHRDIKPTNLLLDHSGTVRILDMGLARIGPMGSSDIQKGILLGTVDFMAPEQGADSRKADARSDIYSLGCTLWYLLNGRRLFDGEKPSQRMAAHRESPRPTLDPIGAGLVEVQNLFESMVAIDPEERFQSAAELVVAIESCLTLLRAELAASQRGESTTLNTTDPGEDSAVAESAGESEVRLDSTSTEDPAAGEKSRRLIVGLSILITLGLLWLFFGNQ